MNKNMLAVFMATVFVASTFSIIIFVAEDADAKWHATCGVDFCVANPASCTTQTCHWHGNGLGSHCHLGNKPSGSSCGGSGICFGSSCFSNTNPSVSVSGPSSVNLFDTATFTASATPDSWKTVSNIKFYVDGAQEGICSPGGSGASITCTGMCTGWCGSGKSVNCCGGVVTTCTTSGGSSSASCNFPFAANSVKTYNYNAVATDSYGKVGTSPSKTFTGVSTCNNNGICELGEDSVSCSADCDATCTDNGVCEAREAIACADCGGICNKDQVCDAGETAAVCPNDCVDFTLSLDPDTGLANVGDAKDINVSVTSTGPIAPVTFTAENLPVGTTMSFSPASCSQG